MSLMAPFTPGLTASATSGAASSSAATPLTKSGQQCRLTNPSGGTQVTAFVKFGDSAVQATVADLPILAGVAFVVTPPSSATHFAVFAATATQVFATSGMGGQ